MNFAKNIFNRQKPFINFTTTESLANTPKPLEAKKCIPEWYRKLKPFSPKQSIVEAGTVKKCIPFLDAVSHGYIIPLWTDLVVQVFYPMKCFNPKGNFLGYIVNPNSNPESIVGKPLGEFQNTDNQEIIQTIEIADEVAVRCVNAEAQIMGHPVGQIGGKSPHKKLYPLSDWTMKLDNPWVIETPKGWSVHIKNPPNRFENFIELYEGVVDSDNYYSPINFPFFWKGNEVGEFLIPKGTPIAQVIPFERQKCDLQIGKTDTKRMSETQNIMKTRITDIYKQEFWHKRKKGE